MAESDRKNAHRLPRIKRGDPIRATYLNALADGVNTVLAAPNPPRSMRVRSDAEQINRFDDLLTGQRVFTTESMVTSLVEIASEADPDIIVIVERIDEITFRSGEELMTLIITWT